MKPIICDVCNERIDVFTSKAGNENKCPNCNTIAIVPDSSQSPIPYATESDESELFNFEKKQPTTKRSVDANAAKQSNPSPSIGLILIGIVVGIFGTLQLLQLLGIIGVGFSFLGIGITAGSLAVSAACFKNAFSR